MGICIKLTKSIELNLDSSNKCNIGYNIEPMAEKNPKKNIRKAFYEEHVKEKDVYRDCDVFSGIIKISSKRKHLAFVTVDGCDKDFFIIGLKDRNRALHGDLVFVKKIGKIYNGEISNLKNGTDLHSRQFTTQKSDMDTCEEEFPLGKVVGIHSRRLGQTFSCSLNNDRSDLNFLSFKPFDSRAPLILCSAASRPKDISINPDLDQNVIFIVSIKHWPASSTYPHGQIDRKLGEMGDLK